MFCSKRSEDRAKMIGTYQCPSLRLANVVLLVEGIIAEMLLLLSEILSQETTATHIHD